jgi:hypothetical protein
MVYLGMWDAIIGMHVFDGLIHHSNEMALSHSNSLDGNSPCCFAVLTPQVEFLAPGLALDWQSFTTTGCKAACPITKTMGKKNIDLFNKTVILSWSTSVR